MMAPCSESWFLKLSHWSKKLSNTNIFNVNCGLGLDLGPLVMRPRPRPQGCGRDQFLKTKTGGPKTKIETEIMIFRSRDGLETTALANSILYRSSKHSIQHEFNVYRMLSLNLSSVPAPLATPTPDSRPCTGCPSNIKYSTNVQSLPSMLALQLHPITSTL